MEFNSYRAEVAGTFAVRLDFDHGNGTLLALDAHLVNYEAYEYGGWQRYPAPTASVGTGGANDPFQPPFVGALTPADYRPLGPDTLTPAMMAPFESTFPDIPPSVNFWRFEGVGFEPAPADSWMLIGDGRRSLSDPVLRAGFPNFVIYLQGSDAYFGFYVPISDATPYFAAAHATLIPEPSALATGAIALISLFGLRGRHAK